VTLTQLSSLANASATGSASVTRLELSATEMRSEWQAVVAADRSHVPEQTPEWLDAVCADDRYDDASRLYECADGRRFVLPLVRRQGPLGFGGRYYSYPPAWGIGGPVGAELDRDVVAAIVADLRSLRAASVSIRIQPQDDPLWSLASSEMVAVPRRGHVIELAETIDDHYRDLSKGTRRYLRVADRSGVTVQLAEDESLLDAHYELYLKSVVRWAEHQREPDRMALWRARRRDPLAKLQSMSRHLGSRLITAIASVDGQPAASSIVLLGPIARETRAAMDIELSHSRASYAVQWAAIEAAYRFGSVAYNMGESGDSEGIGFFKERFGALPIVHSEYRLERFPLTKADQAARRLVKRIIGFRDT